MRILAKNPTDTIFTSGSPRSGTTWLGDLIEACPGVRVVFEPFHKSRPARARALTRRYLRPDGDYPAEKAVLADLLSGRIGDWTGRQLGHRLVPCRLAVKSVRGNLMLEYLHRTFQCPVVYIVRHPCAVIASRLKMGYPSALPEISRQADLMEDILAPWAAEIESVQASGSLVQQHAVLWCAENLLPLKQIGEPWLTTVFYEELYVEPRANVDRIFQAVRLLRTPEVDAAITKVSRTARRDSAVKTGDSVLERWRKDLSAADARTILGTLERFGIAAYGDRAMPEHAALPDPAVAAALSGARPRLGLMDRLPFPEAGAKDLERAWQRTPRRLPFKTRTYCPRLFSEAFVSDRAQVYTCCHFAPWRAGSLEKSSLRDLWNSAPMLAARAMSLAGALPCHDRCTLLDEEERDARPSPGDGIEIGYDRLRRLKLLFGELCNIDCVMCDQDHSSRRQLPLALIRERIDWSGIEEIEFQGGEPLAMNESRKAYAWLTGEMGKKVNFLTNGLVMTREWAGRISRGSSWVYFSVNGARPETHERVCRGARWARVARSLGYLADARATDGSGIALVGHFTIVPQNIMEAPDFPGFAAGLGFDRVEYGFEISTVPAWIRRHPGEVSGLRRRFASVLASPPLPVATYRLRRLGLVD